MSAAEPLDQASPAAPRRLWDRRRGLLTRRSVLGAAVAGGAGVGAIRLLGLERLLPTTGPAAGGRPDWISPLGSEQARVAHLLRRATFGATAAELEKATSDGFSRTVDRLLESKPEAPPPLPGDPAGRLNAPRLELWWLDHMLRTQTPFAERMTLFWHGHFTSDFRKVGLQTPFIYWQNLTWRELALGDLRSMLTRVTTDPAMLRYLDLATSTGAAPNENYSRELMELFTLGAGRFSEDDVRAAAKALAGWTLPRPDGSVEVTLDAKNGVKRRYGTYSSPATGRFNRRRAYDYRKNGPVTFLGKRGTFDTGQVLDRILEQPAAAQLIARKVVQHFVSARVDESYVRRLADRFRASRYDVKTLMREVFTSPEFTAAQSYRALVKSPVEFMVHALKALNAPQLSKLAAASAAGMGQVLFDPPDVGGWPNNESWVSSNTVVARVNFVTQAIAQARALPSGAQGPRFLDMTLSPQTASQLNQAGDDHARWFLTLVSPEFQLK